MPGRSGGGILQAYVETPEMAERGLFRRGLRLIVSYVRMHPGPFLISVAGAVVFALAPRSA